MSQILEKGTTKGNVKRIWLLLLAALLCVQPILAFDFTGVEEEWDEEAVSEQDTMEGADFVWGEAEFESEIELATPAEDVLVADEMVSEPDFFIEADAFVARRGGYGPEGNRGEPGFYQGSKGSLG